MMSQSNKLTITSQGTPPRKKPEKKESKKERKKDRKKEYF